MKSSKVLGVYRERIFSPGKTEDDAAILGASLAELSRLGWETEALAGESLDVGTVRPDCVLTMAQSPRALNILEGWSRLGTKIVNSVPSVRSCYRKPLTQLLLEAGIVMPPSRIMSLNEAGNGFFPQLSTPLWLKRGDVHAIEVGDVVSVASLKEWSEALDHFRRRDIQHILVQEHVDGPVIKFYGVGDGQFFKAYLASSGEDISSEAGPLMAVARGAARAVGLDVYGGDAVLSHGNAVVLVDLNDWPSFSRCCQSAAGSIAAFLAERFNP